MPGLQDETAALSRCIAAAVHLMCKHVCGKQPQNLQEKKVSFLMFKVDVICEFTQIDIYLLSYMLFHTG